jgi:DNA-binding protein HU-beta
MTRAELKEEISQETNLEIIKVSAITESFFEIIKQEVSQGKRVTFKGFGTFFPKKRAAKKVQLIKEKRTVSLSEHFIPAFIPSESFQKKVLN